MKLNEKKKEERELMGHYINPFTDWGFKKLFGQEVTKDILIAFLNGLLDGEHVIEDVLFMDKELLPEAKDMRGLIYDVYCKTESGRRIIVEMQNRDQTHFLDRTTFYMAKAITSQAKRGEWDYELDAVYGVFFMNFRASELAEDRFRTDVELRERDTNRRVSEKLRMIYLQLPCFRKREEECETMFDRFIYTMKNMEILDKIPFMSQNEVFRKLAEIADVNALTQEEQEKYDASIKLLRDNIAVYKGAVREGVQKGREEGLEAGRAEGRAEGLAYSAKQMSAAGMTKETIAAVLQMNIAQLDALLEM